MEKQLEVDAKADEDVYDKMAWHSEIYLRCNIWGCNIGPPTQKGFATTNAQGQPKSIQFPRASNGSGLVIVPLKLSAGHSSYATSKLYGNWQFAEERQLPTPGLVFARFTFLRFAGVERLRSPSNRLLMKALQKYRSLQPRLSRG